jgi:zinc transport system ATP-binding protein
VSEDPAISEASENLQGRPGRHFEHGPACGCGHHEKAAPDRDALVSVRNLALHRGGRPILSGVDLDVRKSEIVTIIGPNGAGKSTLVKIVLGIIKPDSGTVLRQDGLRIGYVPQRFEADPAIPMTVARFMALGGTADAAAIERALREAGVALTARQQITHLSGGETQRVLIARALLREPDLLVLDEPASGVDYAGEAELYDLIGTLRDTRGLGVLLVSHDLHVVMAKSDRVLCLNGHVCCSGLPEAVAKNTEYLRLFGPEAARSLAVYHHHHDHRHDITGAALPIPGPAGASGER